MFNGVIPTEKRLTTDNIIAKDGTVLTSYLDKLPSGGGSVEVKQITIPVTTSDWSEPLDGLYYATPTITATGIDFDNVVIIEQRFELTGGGYYVIPSFTQSSGHFVPYITSLLACSNVEQYCVLTGSETFTGNYVISYIEKEVANNGRT